MSSEPHFDIHYIRYWPRRASRAPLSYTAYSSGCPPRVLDGVGHGPVPASAVGAYMLLCHSVLKCFHCREKTGPSRAEGAVAAMYWRAPLGRRIHLVEFDENGDPVVARSVAADASSYGELFGGFLSGVCISALDVGLTPVVCTTCAPCFICRRAGWSLPDPPEWGPPGHGECNFCDADLLGG